MTRRRKFKQSLAPAVLRLEALEDRRLLTGAAWEGYARDAQHSAQSVVAGQSLDVIHWETAVDSAPHYSGGGSLLIHYGSPVVTSSNTVVVPEKNESAGGFDVKAFDGATGALKWTQTEAEEYVAPPHDWTPSYGPALASLPGGTRLYFPGAAGTVFYRDSPDSTGAVAAGRLAFYGDANYALNPSSYAPIEIASPLTTDNQGNLYFTYRTSASNPVGSGGIARIGADGSEQYADVGPPAMDSAPALSPDGTKLYAVINGFLVEYNAATLAPLAQIQVGTVNVDSSASPTVGPDGDVYFGVLSPFDHDRGSLQHFSADLSQSFTPGSFGWDDTVSIVPASMVPSYIGPSSYLLMTKYNDYAGAGGTGVNKIAIVDPKTSQIDPVTGRLAMTTVLSIAGITPDSEFPNKPGAVREWCINNAVVDPASHSIFANSEDGWLYRWDTTTNTFTQKVQLTSGVGEAYTPTLIGADGTVFAINNAILFAIGQRPGISITGVSVAGNAGPTSAVFTVRLSASSASTVTVNYSTADGTAMAPIEYLAVSGMLTFSPATTTSGGATVGTITVPITGSSPPEGDEYFFVNLGLPVNATIATAQAVGTIHTSSAAVLKEFLFYDHSKYDGNIAGVNAGDSDAIATDKAPYLAGQGSATFSNISSYSRGINGLAFDFAGPASHALIGASDFTFRVGNDNSPANWLAAPAPASISVLAGGGTSGSDRVELLWPDGAIKQQWLEVIVKGTANTGLAGNDVFFFGSEIGDANKSNTATVFKVMASDTTATQTHLAVPGSNPPLTNLFDYDRDGQVGAADITIDQTHGTTNATGLVVLNLLVSGPLAVLPSGKDGDGDRGGTANSAVGSETRLPALALQVATSALAMSASRIANVEPSPPVWIANRLEQLDLKSSPVAKCFERSMDWADTKSDEPLAAERRTLNSNSLDHDAVDGLLASL